MRCRFFAVTAAACVGLGLAASAQSDDTSGADEPVIIPEPCAAPVYDDFDFWVGTWDVTDRAGTLQGRNVITKEERGCLVLERWTSDAGGTGQSYNYADPASGTWRQIWMSAAANIDYTGGRTAADGILLDGEITYRNGTVFPFRGEWVPRSDGTVLQTFHQYNFETKSWDEWFTGIYTRVEDDTDD
ncbi:MAG: hypothetical protein AAGF33_03520 [Pseudomonadota bacterium]